MKKQHNICLTLRYIYNMSSPTSDVDESGHFSAISAMREISLFYGKNRKHALKNNILRAEISGQTQGVGVS